MVLIWHNLYFFYSLRSHDRHSSRKGACLVLGPQDFRMKLCLNVLGPSENFWPSPPTPSRALRGLYQSTSLSKAASPCHELGLCKVCFLHHFWGISRWEALLEWQRQKPQRLQPVLHRLRLGLARPCKMVERCRHWVWFHSNPVIICCSKISEFVLSLRCDYQPSHPKNAGHPSSSPVISMASTSSELRAQVTGQKGGSLDAMRGKKTVRCALADVLKICKSLADMQSRIGSLSVSGLQRILWHDRSCWGHILALKGIHVHAFLFVIMT